MRIETGREQAIQAQTAAHEAAALNTNSAVLDGLLMRMHEDEVCASV